MKLTSVIMLVACLHTYAGTKAQGTITLSEKNAPLHKIFKKIKQQTGYEFLYRDSVIRAAGNVTINLKNASIEQAIQKCLEGKSLDFSIIERTVVIKSREKKIVQSTKTDDGPPVSGIVRGPDGQPLAGVNVVVKGTRKGTVTDKDGRFSIDAQEGSVLEITSIGFGKKEISVNGSRELVVALDVVTSLLDEVQYIAYGQTSRRFNVGNVSSVKSSDIEKQPIQNPLLALQGRVPGLFITQTDGLPGSGLNVRIQGINSIGRGNDPFYVIDGIPYSGQLLTTTGNGFSPLGGGSSGPTGSGSGNPLNFINPADIESIDVLKDADATAIYGSRAANGAILITTKKGKAGKTKIDFNIQQGYGKITKRLDLLNTRQYLDMRYEALKNDSATIPSSSFDLTLWDTTRYTDWQKELIGGTAKLTNVGASVSGGTTNSQYLLGGTYNRITTVFPGDHTDQKGSMHFNLNSISQNQKFKIQFSGIYLVDINKLPGSDLTNRAIRLAPNAPALYNPDGTLNWAPNSSGSSTWINPLSFNLSSYENTTKNLLGNSVFSYIITSGLEVRANFGYTNLQTNELGAYPLTMNAPENRINPSLSRYAYYSNSTISSWIAEPQLNYKTILGKGKIDILVGTTFQKNDNDGVQLSGLGYNSDEVLDDIKSAATVTVNSTVNSTYKYNALFGRLNYILLDKYILNLNYRRDGSSRFGEKNRFHDFKSAGLGWIITQEKFIADNLNFLSFAKLRASMGTTGSDQIGNYQFLNLYDPISVGVPYQGVTGLTANGLPNPNLQWEETFKIQGGIDLGFLNDRILLSINYIKNQTSNQLLSYSLPGFVGFPSVTENFDAKVENTAWEFQFNSLNVKTTNFNWSSSFNLTIPENKLEKFHNLSNSAYATLLVIGKPLSIVKVFDYLGVDPETGIYQFRDNEGKTTFNPDNSKDNIVIINTLPKLYGGFQNTFTYKNFQLDLLFQFVKQIGRNYLYNPRPGSFTTGHRNQPKSVLERWTVEGDIATIQRFSQNSSTTTASNFAQGSDQVYSDASYIRLKNFSLSWVLPNKLGEKMGLNNLKLFVLAQNAFLITKYKGMDPENGVNGTGALATLPPLKIISAGFNLGF